MADLRTALVSDSAFYEDAFRHIVEDNIKRLRETATPFTIDFATGHRWKGNLNGVLNEQGIQPELYWITARINGLFCSLDYDGTKLTLLSPNASVVTDLLSLYKSKQVL